MPTFLWRARDQFGRKLSGNIEADGRAEAAHRVRAMGYYVSSVRAKGSWAEAVSLGRQQTPRLPLHQVVVFTRQLTTVLAAGLSVTEGLEALWRQGGTAAYRQVVRGLKQDVEAGSSLSQALSKYPRTFNSLYVNSVVAGETGGALDEVLGKLSVTLERDLATRRKIRSALYYPVAVGAIAIILIVVLVLFVMPSFLDLFISSGVPLPVPTRILVSLVKTAPLWVPIGLVGALVLVWSGRALLRKPSVRLAADRKLPTLPVVGKVIKQTIVVRFCRTLSTLLGAGVPVLDAVRISKDVIGNLAVAEKLDHVIEAMRQGQRMAGPLSRVEELPPLVSQMVAIGEESGTTERMLARVAEMYDQELEHTIAGLVSLVEPMIIVVLGGGIGFIVASVFLPLVEMLKTL